MGSGIFPLRAFAVPGGQKSGASPRNKQRGSGESHPRQEKKGPVVSPQIEETSREKLGKARSGRDDPSHDPLEEIEAAGSSGKVRHQYRKDDRQDPHHYPVQDLPHQKPSQHLHLCEESSAKREQKEGQPNENPPRRDLPEKNRGQE